MKKLVAITLVLFVISLSVNAKKRSNRVYKELTKTMQFIKPAETIKSQNKTVSYWRIKYGGFYYLTENQEFIGRYKLYNFNVTSNTLKISGINKEIKETKKEARRVKKDLLLDIKSSQFE